MLFRLNLSNPATALHSSSMGWKVARRGPPVPYATRHVLIIQSDG